MSIDRRSLLVAERGGAPVGGLQRSHCYSNGCTNLIVIIVHCFIIYLYLLCK